MIHKLKTYIHIDWKKGLIGLLAAAFLFLTCFEEAPKKVLLLAAVCIAAGFLKLNIRSERWKFTLGLPVSLVCIFVVCLSPTVFLNDIGFNQSFFAHLAWTPVCYMGNFSIITIVCLLVYLFCGSWRAAVTVGTLLMGIFGLIDGQIFLFRGRELIFVDLFSLKTGLNVAAQYTPKLEPFMFFFIGIWIALILLLYMLPAPRKTAGLKGRLSALVMAGALTVTVVVSSAEYTPWSWDTKASIYNGFFLNFYLSARDSVVSKPEDYTSEAVMQMSSDYDDSMAKEKLPNILVIMNESFADFWTLNQDLQTNRPVMPFLRSLEENTIRGQVAVSIFGSNTPNSEFEFLTSHSMAFLPEGSIPYQYYLKDTTYALPWLMSALGYDTFATHPYLASGWARTTTYPRLGFDGYSFEEDYPNQDIVREYVSDREMYEYILQKLEVQEDAPLFLFGITMQNHGGYEYAEEDFEETIWLEGYEDYPKVDQYLSLLNLSDQALEYLLTELESYPEDTLVVFFGDHFPKVEDDFYTAIQNPELSGLEKNMQIHSTPFLIWANYDIPEQELGCTSLSYLAVHMLEAAGIELPPYYQFLKEMEQQIPVMNALGYYSKSQQMYLTYGEAQGEEKRWLDRYAQVQYNNLFDTQNRNETFFARYLEIE